ncbi:MAG: hypothetical protein ACJASO_001020 [Cyclobacteriaceae bacterium]|jgi:hypothetical protein
MTNIKKQSGFQAITLEKNQKLEFWRHHLEYVEKRKHSLIMTNHPPRPQWVVVRIDRLTCYVEAISARIQVIHTQPPTSTTLPIVNQKEGREAA